MASYNPNQYNFGQTKNQYDFNNVKKMPPPSSYGKPQSKAGNNIGKPLGTALRQQTGSDNRPFTSTKGANYQKSQIENQNSKIQGIIDLEKKSENNLEDILKKTEKEINDLIEQSSRNSLQQNKQVALDKAKEATAKERQLRKQREQNGLDNNLELSYSVGFNLAVAYQNLGLYQEALQKYNEIIKSKQFPQAGRLRVNMGNIYFEQKKYSIAIKMYRMALDIIPATSKEMRFKILKNIGHSFVKLGQFHEAISSYDSIVKGNPDFQTCFNLLLCLYALGDKNKLKECFTNMLYIEIPGLFDDEGDEIESEDEKTNEDVLKEELKLKKREAFRFIIQGAKLIAPVIEDDDIQGYDWIIEQIKSSRFPEIESEVEICKAMAHLKKKNIEEAIKTLKSFEKKDQSLMARAASNISFLYFLEQDYKNSEQYADIALQHDRYNAKALVNKGNCLFYRNEFLRSKEQYLEAIGVEADCIEALYNLAFVNKKLNMHAEGLQALDKLQTIAPGLPEVLFQIANIHEQTGNIKQAIKWYQVLLTKIPQEPNVLARLGAIYAREGDENNAFQYFQESYRYLPSNMDTVSWLGFYYVKQDLYERACHFFQRACQIQQKDPKWKLLVAGCYRRIGNYEKSLKMYKDIHQQNPENEECLKFLVLMCKEMGIPYDEYQMQLKRIERARDAMPQQMYGYEDEQYQDQNKYNNQEEEDDQDNNQHINVNVENKQRKIQQKNHDEDDWANGENDDLLLP